MTYKKFFIQQQTVSGTTYTDVGSAVDTYATYHVVCQECPFKLRPEPKEPAKIDWYDEDGEDVYIPSDGLRFKAYDMEVKFLYVGTESNMATELKGFIEFLYGKNSGGSPWLAIYDEYTKTGRRGVYVSGVDSELLAYDDANGTISSGQLVSEVVGVFKVKFRVTDPVYDYNPN